MNRNFILAALGLIVTVVAACGGSSNGALTSQLTGTIDIGSPMSLTGPAAIFGLDEQAGMQFAADEVNSTGYLGQAKINLKFDDVAFSQQQAVTAVKSEIEQGNVSAIVGMTASALSLSVAPIAQSAKTPFIVVESGVSGIVETGNYIFRAGIASPSYQKVTEKGLKSLGIKSVDILIDQTNPLVVEDGVKIADLFKADGIKVINTYQYTPTTTDFTEILTKVRQENPDALGVFAIGKVNLTLITQARQQGYAGRLFGLNSFSVVVGSGVESQCEGCVYATGYSADAKNPSTQKFVAAYKAKSGKVPTSFVAEGYDGVWLLARGLKAAGSKDRAKLRDGIEQVTKQGFAGAQGPLTFENRDVRGPGLLIIIHKGKDELQQ